MNGRVAKVLRKMCEEDNRKRQYNIVKHIKTLYGEPKGNFIMASPSRRQYQIAKRVYLEAPGKQRHRLYMEALRAIDKREMAKAIPVQGSDQLGG